MNVNTVYNELLNINVISQSLRPITYCKFRRSTAKALYDTGSSVTCMNDDTYQNLHPDEKALSQNGRSFRSASGDQMKTRGTFDLQMQVEGKMVSQKVHVIPTLHEPFILGIDFIREHGLNYCPKHHHFHWDEHCPLDHGSILVLKERMVIPPLCSRLCNVRIDGNQNSEGLGIATVKISDMPWIRGGPVLIENTPTRGATVEIRNASPVPRELPRNCKLGVFERIDEENVMSVDELQGGPEVDDEETICAMYPGRTRWTDVKTPRGAPRSAGYYEKDRKFIDDKINLKCEEVEKLAYKKLFYDHASVFSKHKNDIGRCNLVQHEIHLKDKNPVYIKQFKIPEVHATSIEEQVKEWLKLDIVQPSMSRYNSPIFVVKKKDGAFRLVQDFRALNAQTYPDRYSMRDVTDCIHEIGKSGSSIFSTIDLTSGFWQMVLKPECRPYTAFTVYGMGQFEFKTSPMGLLGCPASFQRLMEAVMKGIPNVLVYIDDILVHSKTHQQHREILGQVFRRLEKHNLKIGLEKCFFATREVEYLGFRLTPDGVLPGTDKTAVIKNASPPDNVQRVRQFLGLCNFFRNHIRDFATRSHPLTILTRKDCPWKGGELPPDALKAFNELKSALTSSPIIAFPRKDRQYALITDAATGDENNPGGMGAILTQIDGDGKFYVIAYASRKLVKHELNYTPFLLEMHAAVWGMEHFSHHLKGKRFLLFTDHKPLEKLGKVHTKTLYRIQEAMMEYDFEIFYKKGEEMPADFLSRNICSLTPDLSLENIGRLQKLDTQLSVIINYLKSGNIPKSVNDRQLIAKYGSRCFLDKDVLWIRFLKPEIGLRSVICLPTPLRQTAIDHMHSSWYGGHSGTLKTVERLLLYYYWPGIHNDVQTHLSQCERCQKRQTNPKIPNAQLQPLPLLSEPNQRVHADLFGPLRTSDRGKKFILVMTDAFTRYVELVAIANKETETVANAIFVHWICRYGVPLEIVTDQGKEFVSNICQSLWDKLKLVHNTTTPRHPQANAQAEVVNRTIIRYLSSFVDDSTLDWEIFLAPLMFSYNTTFHRSLKTSPFFMTFGVHPRLPNDIITPQYGSDLPTEVMQRLQVARNIARTFMDKAALEYKEQHDSRAKQRDFVINQQVLLDEHSFLHKNQKLCPKFSGPHIITRLKGAVDVELLLNNGRRVVVHVNRIKPFKDGVPSTPGSVSQNGGGVDDDNESSGILGQPLREQRMTRSQAKKLGLVYNPETLAFSQPETLQAIGRTKKPKKKKQGKKPKSEQVISHYISRDFDSENEWDSTPEWGEQSRMDVDMDVDMGETSSDESEDEFMDVQESFSTPATPVIPKPESKPMEIPPPPQFSPQKEPVISPKKEPIFSPKKEPSVRFQNTVKEYHYETDPSLQESRKTKDRVLLAAKAAVKKIKEEVEDALSQKLSARHSTELGRGGFGRGMGSRGGSGPHRRRSASAERATSPSGTGARETTGGIISKFCSPEKHRHREGQGPGQSPAADATQKLATTATADTRSSPPTGTSYVPTCRTLASPPTDTNPWTSLATSESGYGNGASTTSGTSPATLGAATAAKSVPTFGFGSTTFGTAPSGIPGVTANYYAAHAGHSTSTGRGTTSGTTSGTTGGTGRDPTGGNSPASAGLTGSHTASSASETAGATAAYSEAGRYGSPASGYSPTAGSGSPRKSGPASLPTETGGRVFGSFGDTGGVGSRPESQFLSFGQLSDFAKRGLGSSTAIPKGRVDPETETPPKTEQETTRRLPSKDDVPTRRSTVKSPANTRTRSTGPQTRGKLFRDEFGLYPFHPGPEGSNEAFYVTLLADRWKQDEDYLRDRTIAGEPPSEQTIAEQQRRFRFILREAQRTNAIVPKHFTID